MESVVDAALGDQFLMRAEFLDRTVVQNQYAVAFLDGLQSVGDDDRRATLGELMERVLNDEFRAGIDAGRCLVEHEDFRV